MDQITKLDLGDPGKILFINSTMSREGKTKEAQYIEFTDDTVNPLLRITGNKNHKDNTSTRKGVTPNTRTKPNIVPILPTNDLLTRVSAFLPKLAQANKELELVEDKSRCKIELSSEQDDTCDEGSGGEDSSGDELKGRVIEMNIGLGVLEDERGDERGSDIRIWIKDDVSSDSDSSGDSSKG